LSGGGGSAFLGVWNPWNPQISLVQGGLSPNSPPPEYASGIFIPGLDVWPRVEIVEPCTTSWGHPPDYRELNN